MIRKILGKLLHVANSYPEAVSKDRFYVMKSDILSRHGDDDGHDVQHFEGKRSWNEAPF